MVQRSGSFRPTRRKAAEVTGHDVLSPAQRKYCMSRIRGINTTPEVLLRKALWVRRLRYRLRQKIIGRPDLVFPRLKLAIFVDGCFWHGCPRHGVLPKNNARFWATKLARNRARDRQVNKVLSSNGWKVVRFWEHEIEGSVEKVANFIARTMRQLSNTSGCRRAG